MRILRPWRVRPGVVPWWKRLKGVQWVGFAGLVVAAVLTSVLWLASRTPVWHRVGRQVTDARQVDAAANRFEDRLVELGNFAAGGLAAEARQSRAGGSRSRGDAGGETGEASARWVWTLDGEEANAFLRRWAVLHRGEPGLAGYLAGDAEPVVSVREGRVLGSARVPAGLGFWPVVTVAWRPRLEPGGLAWALEECWVGRLPVPASMARWMLTRAAGPLREGVRRWQADARVDGRGRGNMPMALASGGQLLLSLLEGGVGSDVVFVPVDERHSAAVRVVGVSSSGEGMALRVTLELVPPAEREAAAARTRGLVGERGR